MNDADLLPIVEPNEITLNPIKMHADEVDIDINLVRRLMIATGIRMPAQVETNEESASWLNAYARIPIAFRVESVLAVEIDGHGLGGVRLSEQRLEQPYVKDYDVLPNCHPTQWAARFDMTNWGFFSAKIEGTAVGGAVVAWCSPHFHMLEQRTDLGVVWDVRVVPEMRRRGVAAQLFAAAQRWALDRGCRQLKVETQNINVPACKFYASLGFELGAIHRFAYRELPHEIQLLWYKTLY